MRYPELTGTYSITMVKFSNIKRASMSSSQTYIAAIESGGSHCRGILYDRKKGIVADQVILRQPANIFSDRGAALLAIQKILDGFGALPQGTHLTLCLAGTEDPRNVDWLEKHLKWTGDVYITSDVIAGFFGAFQGLEKGCGMFIGGTGNIAIGYDGGDGFLCIGGGGDEKELCCGYSIGWHALASPELADNEQFKKICAEISHVNKLKVLDLSSPKYAISQLAPHVFELAETSADAQRIINRAVDGGFHYLEQLYKHGIKKFGLIGGVAHRIQSLLRLRIAKHGLNITLFPASDTDGLMGALNVAGLLEKDASLLNILNKRRMIEG
jgi:N-acetylglucosamine kinase-like BadF-type ATPase